MPFASRKSGGARWTPRIVRPEADLRVTRVYISAKIWAQAVEAADTTDGVPVAQALHSGTFGVFGVEARFDAEGNMQGPLGEPALWV
jgi:ABC-type branched-subunit amino acid transport system substrate-binding protein